MSKARLFLIVLGLVLCGGALSADPPPIVPSNACEAQCLAGFRQCEVQCSRVLCLVPCSLLFNACLANNCTTG